MWQGFLSFFLFFKIYLFIYLFKKGEGRRKRGRETSMDGCLGSTPYWGPGPQPRYVSLTGNRTRDPLVCRPVLKPLSHTSQSRIFFLMLNTIPFYVYTIFVYPFICWWTWVASWLFWTVLLWTWVCICVFKTVLSVLFVYLEVDFLIVH